MSRGASLSLLGMYSWNDTLFDEMTYPDDFTADQKQLFVNNVLMECAELEIIYPDWDFLKFAINTWSAKEVFNWNRLYAAMMADYNPIENYNRSEDMTETHSGIDSNQVSGIDSDSRTGYDSLVGSGTDTDTHSKTAYDSNAYAATDKIEMSKGSTQTNNYNSTISHTNGRKDTYTHGHTIRTAGTITGNIGTMTAQNMLEQEVEIIPKLNVINAMIDSFKNRFCLLVY